MTGCGSVNTHVVGDISHLQIAGCTCDASHQGQCQDRNGRTWTRLEELLRQDGLRLFGYLVQRIES